MTIEKMALGCRISGIFIVLSNTSKEAHANRTIFI